MFRFLCIGIALLALVSHASAETKSLDVNANRATGVGYFATYGKATCKGGQLPKFKIKKQPKNGKVRFEKYTQTFDKKAGKCAGAKIPGMAVVYTPNRGFRGKDTFTIGYPFTRYAGGGPTQHLSYKYKLTVK